MRKAWYILTPCHDSLLYKYLLSVPLDPSRLRYQTSSPTCLGDTWLARYLHWELLARRLNEPLEFGLGHQGPAKNFDGPKLAASDQTPDRGNGHAQPRSGVINRMQELKGAGHQPG